MDTLSAIPKLKDQSVLGRIRAARKDVLGFAGNNFETYGSVYRTDIFGESLIMTRKAEWIQHVLQTNHRNYIKGRAYRQLNLALGEGLLTSQGELWKKQRKLIQPAFYKKRLDGLLKNMETSIASYLPRWHELRDQGKEVRIDLEFLNLTSDIVISTLLGASIKDSIRDLPDMIVEMQEYLIKRIRIPFYDKLAFFTGEHARFLRLRKRFDEAVYKVIEERKRSNETHNDLLGMLMDAVDEETGEGMDLEQLRDEFITIFVAGHETTAFALTWAFYLLGQNPDYRLRLREEASRFDPQSEDLLKGWSEMPLINAVIKESMRLYPPAYFVSREAVEDDVIDNHLVKKGQVVILSIYHLHRDPEAWENPLRFYPERFMTDKPGENERHKYFPFGAGPRMCIGNHFAMMEAALVLANFFNQFDFELVQGQQVSTEPLITLRPKEGLKVRLT